jgi:dipeptidyl aminopeptidase/acylaminoacyl peptidase
MAKRLAAILALVLPSCSSPSGPDGPGSQDWLSAVTTFQDALVTIEKVTYRSDGLVIEGQVCRPRIGERHPVLLINHGGFEGLGGEWNGGFCKDLAVAGYVVAESSFRGEDGSEGEVEFCLGEVTDSLTMLDITLAQPYARRDRALMMSVSHGGCIGLRALERGAAVQAAVDVFGPTEGAELVGFWKQRVAAGDPRAAEYRELIDTVEAAVGGTPQQVPGAYQARSPVAFASQLDAWPGSLLVVHGTADPLVPVRQSCLLAERARDFHAYFRDPRVGAIPNAPPGCEGLDVEWLGGPLPGPSWPERRYLVVYRGGGHDYSGPPGIALLGDVLSFLGSKAF